MDESAELLKLFLNRKTDPFYQEVWESLIADPNNKGLAAITNLEEWHNWTEKHHDEVFVTMDEVNATHSEAKPEGEEEGEDKKKEKKHDKKSHPTHQNHVSHSSSEKHEENTSDAPPSSSAATVEASKPSDTPSSFVTTTDETMPPVAEDGFIVSNLEELDYNDEKMKKALLVNPKYAAIFNRVELNWYNSHPVDISSKEKVAERDQLYAEYKYGKLGDPHAPSIGTDVMEQFKNEVPDGIKEFYKSERNKIYTNPEDDPFYSYINKQILLSANAKLKASTAKTEDFNELYAAARKELYAAFLREFPQKAAAYAKQNTHLAQVAEEERLRRARNAKTYSPPTRRTFTPFQSRRRFGSAGAISENVTTINEELLESEVTTETTMNVPIPSPSEEESDDTTEASPSPSASASTYTGSSLNKQLLRSAAGRKNLRSVIANKAKQKANNAKMKALEMAANAAFGPEAGLAIKLLNKKNRERAKWLLIGILIALAYLLFMIMGGMSTSPTDTSGTGATVTLHKSGPEAVSNDSPITYSLSVSFPSNTSSVTITDEIPKNAEFVSATGNPTLTKDTNGRVTKAIWTVNKVLAETDVNGGSGGFNQTKFEGYGFPTPSTSNPVSLTSEDIRRWNEILPHAVKASAATGVDIGIIGMWPVYEGIHFNAFYDNCNDPAVRKNTPGADYDPNTPCPVNNWQVGLGVRPAETANYLTDALDTMYGDHTNQTVQKVGQSVIDKSKTKGPPYQITYPSASFPDVSIETLLWGLRANSPELRTQAAILMKDDAIGIYILARVFQGIIGPSMASRMEAYGSYYQKQKIIDTIKAVYDKQSAVPDATTTQTVSITLRPLEKDTYIMNTAFASSTADSFLVDISPIPVTQDNCKGTYRLDNPIGNFGDPNCEFIEDKLSQMLQTIDKDNEEAWYLIAKCESGHNPNAYASHESIGTPDAAGAWGLFQMGSSLNGPGTPGKGKNGDYDRGDVQWQKQISNAVAYNNALKDQGLIWQYWACADQIGLWD